ncbi:MAG: potassium channel family protein [Nocardioidaceae bacterium]|jgi:voltage-gated potassium channel|nr:potassium channel family protein [Nocardioidaceae bacterium]
MPSSVSVKLPAHALTPGRALGVRLLIAVGLLATIVLLVYLDRDGYRDNAFPDGEVDLLDTVYYSTVTLTTTGYGDIAPVSPAARFVNATLVTPLRIMFLILLVGTTLEVLATQGREQLRINRWRKHMHDHVIVIGYGTKGRSAVKTLVDNGVDKQEIIVIDPDHAASTEAQGDGMACVVGDASRREVLERATIREARQIVVTADRDDSAVLVTLMARQLNPEAYIVVAVRESQNVDLVKQSGADATVTSSDAVGRLLGLSTVSPALGSVLEDLLTTGAGLEVAERDVQPFEVGKSCQQLDDQAIGVIRRGHLFRYFDPAVTQLELGDKLIVVRSAEELPWAPRPGAEPS